ncbi:periodic tryptophan protein 2 homolog [Episyrphus balteatus]|uniref:periodic tryptophan protein 2 homolog n=1 Tax=Episyrphus balteatus TaxID=286459 RepID=UPI00248682EA|nr:periodic tryptophan protein 2 homolog [Episyrphus balteatus]
MKFSYKFSNLLGTIYRNGNLCFTPDGNSVISPVGNRLTIFDLKNNTTKTLTVESGFNYTSIALSPNGSQLIAVNEKGQAQLISLLSCAVVHRHKFQNKVNHVQYSPDGLHFAVAKENIIFIFKAPGELTGEYNPFVLEKHHLAAYDDITWIDWSSDSRFLAIGCRDNSTKIIAIRKLNNFRTTILGGHTEPIVGCFFDHGCLDLNTLSRNGQLCIWKCSLGYSDIQMPERTANQEPEEKRIKKKGGNTDDESDDDFENGIEEKNDDENNPKDDENQVKDDDKKKLHLFYYKKLGRHYLADEPKKENRDAHVTAAAYNQKTHILVAAFSTGSFYLYELPEVNIIHSLSISDYAISSVCFNPTGDWVAMASSGVGQLLVWEWQSEQYIMKQQGHNSEMSCITYSPDGQYIATGGQDHKVKLWNTSNGFCFVTFSEHTSSVTGVQFSKNKKFLVSSSLDGTVRAYDIIRYRNFRTFTSPRPVQFACVAIDHSGELIVAGGQDVFEIYLWSVKLGKLLEILSGHEGPVTAIAFSPIPTASTLISGSWDKTIKVWNCLESNSDHETIDMMSDVTCVAFKPNGEEIAVGTLNGNITVFDVKTTTQIASIEGRNDLGSGRSAIDLITSKKNKETKCFKSIEYSADGECILAGGKSQFVCIYHVMEGMLLKKFAITQNKSFDSLDESLNRRKMTEFGNMALVEKREDLEGGNVMIRLPGVQKGDMASRHFMPEVNVYCVRFSPTGQSWAAACTEGLMVYSLDKGVVFDPFDLSMEVTPKATVQSLKEQEYSKALIMSLKLNEINLITSVIEGIPLSNVELVCSSLPNEYAHRTLQAVTGLLRKSPHIEFYLRWVCCLLTQHGNKDNIFQHHSLLGLHESLSRKYEMLNKMCDFNKYTLTVLSKVGEMRRKSSAANGEILSETNDEDLDENMILLRTSSNLENNDDLSEFEEDENMSTDED